MKFINLTPHPITIDGLGTIEPSGTIARVATLRTVIGAVEGVRVTAQNMGQVTGLPDSEFNVAYIVSGMVLDAIKRHVMPGGESRAGKDVYAPDTGADAVRDERGHIVAVRGLVA